MKNDDSFDSLLDDSDYENSVYDANSKFRLNSKSFFLTYPQCDLDPKVYFKLLRKMMKERGIDVNVCVSSSEDHKNSEGKHIHTYFVLNKKINVISQNYFDIVLKDKRYHPNVQKPKNKVFVLKYIVGLTKKKIDDPKNIYEFGIDVKKFLLAKKNHRRNIYKQLLEKEISVVDAIKEDPSLIICYKSLKNNLSLYWSDLSSKIFLNKRFCFWIFGNPGIGKSYCVRTLFPQLYLKDCTKWWDGYIDQNVVLIDDFDSREFYHYLKIWSDNYLFNAEIKGGIVECKYHFLFITSNYTIYDLFFDPKDVKSISLVNALNRRFVVINANDFVDGNGYFFFEKKYIEMIENFDK